MRGLLLLFVIAPAPPTHGATLAEHASAHFTFRYPKSDAANIGETAERVEREYARIVDALGVTDMPRVQVTFYTSHDALVAATRGIAGVVPSWAYGLVTAADQIHCMSPNHPSWGPYDRRVGDVVHEFAHAVTLHMNPTIANNPRWLWEAVAIYESDGPVDSRGPPCMRGRRPPSLSELNAIGDRRIYEVGYTIAEFVVTRWGAAALRGLIVKNGDTDAALGLTLAEFETQWIAFVRSKYQISMR